jgi:putative Mg2+ transporter-C (MgtC) family protein
VELIQNAANWLLIWEHLRDLGLAYLLALPIAWDREISERTAGLRTFPLVAVAACAYMLTGYEVLDSSEAHARVMEGLITGIGFIGGGAILKDSGSVRGTATAASLWGTGAIGLAVASQRLEIAVVVSVVTFLTLRFLKPLLRSSARPFHKPDSQEDS